ncbi:hypothetical protein [Bacillus sp. B1-b2]|uniref:hypothetical protein n=1 Tax=Bacillus sp. B1-b2 TaxID=2653201 RepID=UPI001261D201|nr:hypothetical protein [Bacillus sp. B1-b2]KAB7663381.1 hypothetical protein F9279_24095 [Bacillus sp. B1-b2]
MVKKLIDNVFYVISILFLTFSFLSATFLNENFTYRSLLNTDGLTLLGIIFALVALIFQKIPIFRRAIIFVLLRLNFWQLDYRFEISLCAPKEIKVEDLFKYFSESVENFDNFKSNKFKVNFTNKNKMKIFHRALAANVEFDKTIDYSSERDSNLNYWNISVDGVSSYRIVERNIIFMINTYLEKILKDKIISTKINLTISKNNTEFDLEKIGVLLSARKYKLNHSNIQIDCNENTIITINSNYGITMTSQNKGDFSNSLEALKSVLIS